MKFRGSLGGGGEFVPVCTRPRSWGGALRGTRFLSNAAEACTGGRRWFSTGTPHYREGFLGPWVPGLRLSSYLPFSALRACSQFWTSCPRFGFYFVPVLICPSVLLLAHTHPFPFSAVLRGARQTSRPRWMEIVGSTNCSPFPFSISCSDLASRLGYWVGMEVKGPRHILKPGPHAGLARRGRCPPPHTPKPGPPF